MWQKIGEKISDTSIWFIAENGENEFENVGNTEFEPKVIESLTSHTITSNNVHNPHKNAHIQRT